MSLQKRVKQRTQTRLGRALKEEQGKLLATMCKDLFSALWSAVDRVGASAKKGKCAESDGEGKTLRESERVGGRTDERREERSLVAAIISRSATIRAPLKWPPAASTPLKL